MNDEQLVAWFAAVVADVTGTSSEDMPTVIDGLGRHVGPESSPVLVAAVEAFQAVMTAAWNAGMDEA